jgi:hypothetical protein
MPNVEIHPDDQILTEEEAARYRRVHVATIRRQRRKGKLRFIQLSQRRFGYRLRDLKVGVAS